MLIIAGTSFFHCRAAFHPSFLIISAESASSQSRNYYVMDRRDGTYITGPFESIQYWNCMIHWKWSTRQKSDVIITSKLELACHFSMKLHPFTKSRLLLHFSHHFQLIYGLENSQGSPFTVKLSSFVSHITQHQSSVPNTLPHQHTSISYQL